MIKKILKLVIKKGGGEKGGGFRNKNKIIYFRSTELMSI